VLRRVSLLRHDKGGRCIKQGLGVWVRDSHIRGLKYSSRVVLCGLRFVWARGPVLLPLYSQRWRADVGSRRIWGGQ